MTSSSTEAQKQQSLKTVKKLMLVVFAMFGFGFAMVPLYDVFCDITGLNGKTSGVAARVNTDGVDTQRTVTVQFISHKAKGIPWQFEPMINEVTVHPGEMKLVKFYAKNESVRDIVGQAVPSVSPGKAAVYLHKIECFCFNQQPLEQGHDEALGLQFYIDPDLPKEYSTVTLSYTLFDISNKIEKDAFAELFANAD